MTMTENSETELSWKIVNDPIGHPMTTKEIVEMYAEHYGYRREPPGLVPLDFEKLWVEFEKFLEPHTCDLIIQPQYARNAVLIQNWLKQACQKYAAPAVPSVEKINRVLINNAHGCQDVNSHHGVGKIEKGCTMCLAESIHDLMTKGDKTKKENT